MREDRADSVAAGPGDEPDQPGAEGGADHAADTAFGRHAFDEEFVRSASFREPSAWARGMDPVGPHPDAARYAGRVEPRRAEIPVSAHRSQPKADHRHLVAIAVAVAVVAGAVYFVAGRSTFSPGRSTSTRAAAGGVSSPPTLAASTASPFAGTPADSFADGAQGIEPPTATPTAGFDAAQVAVALRASKALLVAANLDSATLRGAHPDAFLALLDPKDITLRETVRDALAHPSRSGDITLWTTRFDPREASLVDGQPVKVRGAMTVAPADDGLRVHADYLFVYALRSAASRPGGATWARVAVRRTVDVDLVDTHRFVATAGAIRLRAHSVDFSNATCGPYDGFIHPYFGVAASGGPTPSGSPVDPYDLSRPLGAANQDSCGMVSRV